MSIVTKCKEKKLILIVLSTRSISEASEVVFHLACCLFIFVHEFSFKRTAFDGKLNVIDLSSSEIENIITIFKFIVVIPT